MPGRMTACLPLWTNRQQFLVCDGRRGLDRGRTVCGTYPSSLGGHLGSLNRYRRCNGKHCGFDSFSFYTPISLCQVYANMGKSMQI